MKKIFPSLVLAIICIAISGLLAFANKLTEPKIAQANEEKLTRSLTDVFGDADYRVSEKSFENVNSVITDEQNRVIFDITVDGYEKNGIQALIGIDSDGRICGIGIVSLKETAGVGTKIKDNAYIQKYIGLDNNNYPDDIIISGATYSSKGMRNAVSVAMNIYESQKSEGF